MFTTLLILHGLLAVALLGGITHQLVSAYRTPAPAKGFIGRYGAVNGAAYTNAMIVLYLASAVLGSVSLACVLHSPCPVLVFREEHEVHDGQEDRGGDGTPG